MHLNGSTPEACHGDCGEQSAGHRVALGERQGLITDRRAIARHLPSLQSQIVLNRCLLMRRARILDSSVCRGMPNLAAAPEGPETLPCESARAASILSRS